MVHLKHHTRLGVVALVCLLIGFLAVSPLPIMERQAYADTEPDLYIESISWLPELPALNDAVTFTTTIRNQGGSTAGPCSIAYYIDDNLISVAEVGSINAGTSALNSFEWQATANEHTIKAVIDYENTVTESDEYNNEKTYAFSVKAPDLIIDSITWSPQTVSSGETVTFTVNLKNRGNVTVNYCWIEFFIDSSSRGQKDARSINPGEIIPLEYTWTAQPGEHTLKATADVLNQITEGNENNNSLTTTYSTALPDLIIYSITQSPTDRTETDNVTMHVTVKNNGIGAAYGSWLNFYVDGTLQASISIGALAKSATETRTHTWMVGPDEHTFTAVIDATNQVLESYETNNSKTVTLPALSPADLLIESITWTPTQPIINNMINFTITVKNAGQRDVDKCYLDFYLAYGVKFNRQIGPVVRGGTASVSIECLCPTNLATVRAIVDPNNYITESDETNNEKTASLTAVGAAPAADFYLKSFTCTPESPAVGDQVTFTTQVKNNYNKPVPESNVGFYVDGVLIQTARVKSLSPKNTTTLTFTWTATAGTHVIKAVADYNDEFPEIYENNNEKEIVLSVLSPDLTISGVTWTPEVPSRGDTVTITLTIANAGTYKSSGCYVKYYVDGLNQGNHYIEEIAAGDAITRTFLWTMENDYLTYRIIIDAENTLDEADETNNEKTVNIPAPDLTIESLNFAPDEFFENETVTITITVRNTGITESDATYLDCYIFSVLQASLPVGPIPAGSSVDIVFEWTALAGQNTFTARIDGDNSVIETDEGNNQKSIILQTTAVEDETSPATTGTEAENPETTSNETVEVAPGLTDDSNIPPGLEDLPTIIPIDALDELSEVFGEDLPAWQEVLGNKWIIIGVAVIGGAGILILLMLRRRSQAV